MNKKKPLDWGAISLDSLFTFERGKEKNMAALAVLKGLFQILQKLL